MIEEVTKWIEESYYWDARVKTLECNYFGDEVKLVFEENERDIVYHFEECYKINIDHLFEYPKSIPARELKDAQIPYFMQDVELNEITMGDKKYMEFRIDMHPIKMHVICKKFNIS